MAKSVVGAEQLGRSLVQQHHGNGGHNTFRQHVGAVVSQAVDPRGQTIAQVAPDQHAGQKAAQETQHAHGGGAHGHADQLVFERLGKYAGKPQKGEGQHIIQQDHAHQRQQAGRRGRIKAQQHLQQAVHKAGEQAPLDPVAEGYQNERHHAEQRDGAAVGQLIDFDVGQDGAQRNHQGAFYHNARFGVRG